MSTLEIKYFFNVSSVEELKKQFRKLAKEYHPDMGGTNDDMRRINNEYEYLKEFLDKGKTFNGNRTQEQEKQMDEHFRQVIMKIAHLPIDIEICGEWIWVSGETYPYRQLLGRKENGGLGFQWSKAKKRWYWAPYELGKKRRTNVSMDEIRNKYGSYTVQREERKQLN